MYRQVGFTRASSGRRNAARTTIILYSTLWRGLRRATLGLESGEEAARTRTIRETCENWRGTSTSPPRCALNWFQSTSEKNAKPSDGAGR